MSQVGRAQRRFDRAEAGFARDAFDAQLLLEIGLVEGEVAELLALDVRERRDIVVEPGTWMRPSLSLRAASMATNVPAGLVTPPPNVPECRSCLGPMRRSS